MSAISPTLAHLLQPLAIEAFLSRYYQREMLIIERGNPLHYEGLLGFDSLQEMIGDTAMSADDILVVDESRQIDDGDYLRADGRVDAIQVQRLFDEGATITLRQLQNKVPAIARLCHSVVQQLSCACQANLYFSPPNAQGFLTHHDTHDVFVLQLLGSKQWRTYEPMVRLPLPGQRFYWEQAPDAAGSGRFALRAGDLLYCPRGTPHNARATTEPSVHLSLGALVSTWAEYLLQVIADVALRDPALRAALPTGYATSGVAPEVLRQTLQDLLARASAQARPTQVLEAMANQFIHDHPTPTSGQLGVLLVAAALSLESHVGARPGLLYRLYSHGQKLTLIGNSRQITLPLFTNSPLQFALSNAAYRVRDLPGPLTGEAKLALIRRLMKEGMVIAAHD